MSKVSIKELEYLASQCRRKVLRMIEAGGAGHMGGAMSCIDIVTALYFYAMNVDPQNPAMPERDRFILSAGHKCMAQYAVLAQMGFFDEKVLDTYGKLNTKIPGHPDMHKLPGVEANTGALGHGLSIALGMALGLRMDSLKSRVFVVMGDGELTEGSNWEAAAAAAKYKASNLSVFIDYNGLQISGKVKDVMDMNPLARFAAFGWSVKEINGNSMGDIVNLINSLPLDPVKPSLIVANTTKSKGLSFAEGIASYHYWKPNAEEMEKAITETEKKIKEAAL